MNNADIIVDLQFGSTGKGAIAGYLAATDKYDVVVNANMPNAGHTYIDKHGVKHINKVLPTGHTNPDIGKIMLGPASVFSKEQLFKEIRFAESNGIKIRDRLIIHPNAVVLDPKHVETEQENLTHIASTMQGSAAATVDKMMRTAGSMPLVANHEELHPYVISQTEWLEIMNNAMGILVEGSQGYSLGINGPFYPYTTSRSCTPAAFMDYCGVPIRCLNDIIGTARTYPIRVGNTSDGYSGTGYPDQEEVSWDELGVEAETTTVTGRIRRVFTFSDMQIQDALRECQPNKIFLNFANYCDSDELLDIVGRITHAGQQLNLGHSIIKWFGYGPNHEDILNAGDVSHGIQ